jgi:DNA polymerase I-like protein with 3'-5' exonuclease and polymerase domains
MRRFSLKQFLPTKLLNYQFNFTAAKAKPGSTAAAQAKLKGTSQRLIFSGWSLENAKNVALFDPVTGESKEFPLSQPAEVAKWIRDRCANQETAIVPFQDDEVSKTLSKSIAGLKNVVLAPDAWTIVCSTFFDQRRSIVGLKTPESIEEAFQTLTSSPFPQDTSSEAVRHANLVWETLIVMFTKIGSGGGTAKWHSSGGVSASQKALSPVDQLLRKAFRPVRTILVAVETPDPAKSSILDPVKYKVLLHDVQVGQNVTVPLQNLTTDKNLATVAVHLSEPNTVSVLVPVNKNSRTSLNNIVKRIRARCPLITITSSDLGAADLEEKAPSAEIWNRLCQAADGEVELKKRIYAIVDKKVPQTKSVAAAMLVPKQKKVAATSLTTPSGITSQKVARTASPDLHLKLEAWNAQLTNAERLEKERAIAKKYERFLVVDVECTTKKTFKRTSNPFDPDNRVVLPGYLDHTGRMTIPQKFLQTREDFKLPDLSGYDVLVGHNIKFDLLYMWKDPNLVAFFKRGGVIWDTMYAQYLLTGHQCSLGRGAGLEDVARSYGGTIAKLDEVKEAWAAGKDTTEIPIPVLRQYLEGDLRNTELIFRAQVKLAADQAQMMGIRMRMDGLCCTTEMEFNGLQINRAKAEEQMAAAVKAASVLKRSLDDAVPNELGSLKKYFNWASLQHLSAYLFGGKMTVTSGSREVSSSEVQDGAARYIGPPLNVLAPCHCAFLAKNEFVPRTSRVFKNYYEPTLRKRGFRATEPVGEALGNDDIAGSYNVTLLAIEPATAKTASDVTAIHYCDYETKKILSFKGKDITLGLKGLLKAKPNTDLLLICKNSATTVLPTVVSELIRKENEDAVVHFADLERVRRYVTHAYRGKTTWTRQDDAEGTQWLENALKDLKQTMKIIQLSVEEQKQTAADFLESLNEKDSKKRKPKADSDATRTKLAHAEYYKNMTVDADAQPDALDVLRLLGLTCGSAEDAFECLTDAPPEAEVTLPGRLLTLFPRDGVSKAEQQANQAKRHATIQEFTSKETGRLQVGTETLQYFAAHGDTVCKNIEELRAYEKLISTYFDMKRGGMMSLVHPHDDRIHHSLIHNKTATGRLSSANPNCQNIPKEDKVRELFVSRFPDGVCLEADYSQLEVIALCALSRDPQMTQDILDKVDFHCKRVTMMRPDLTYEDVVKKAKVEKIQEFVDLRQKAKIFSFQRQYGAGAAKIAKSTGLSKEAVLKMIQNETLIYAGNEIFSQMVTLSVNQYNPNLQDGARNLKGDFLFKGKFVVPTGTQYVFTEADIPDEMVNNVGEGRSTGFSPTKLKNYPVQGFAGEIVQFMLGKLWRHFVNNDNYGGNCLLTNTVHDSVWLDARESVRDTVAKDVEHLLAEVKPVLNETWPEFECQVDFPVDVVAGKDMGHMKPIPKPKK